MSTTNEVILQLEDKVSKLQELYKNKKDKMEIAVAGNVKAGKSTLSNALFDQEELFATGVVRTTSENSSIDSEYFRLMDTPGINANNQDTEVAEEGYEKSDFFLFVHNIIDGELLVKEIKFLNQLKSKFKDDEQFARNIFIILTNAHQLEENDLHLAVNKIKQQLQIVTQLELTMFIVDSVSYLNALKQEKALLMEDSQIPSLRRALEEKAKTFNENISSERQDMLSVKKDEILGEINTHKNTLEQHLRNLKENTLDVSTIKSLLEDVKAFPKKVEERLDYDKFLSKHRGSVHSYIEVSSLRSSYTYSSESSAVSAGVGVLRDKVMPKVEKEYIRKRRDLIDHYRNLLPNFGGQDSEISKMHYEIEADLTELKSSLLPLANAFDLKNLAESSTTLNIPKQDTSDEPALQHSSSIHASGFEYDYHVESASWYDSYIDTNYRTEYKRGLFGEKEIEKYSYDAHSAKYKIEKHLNDSIKGAHDSIRSAFSYVYNAYVRAIKEEVNKIISSWIQALEAELKKGSKVQNTQQDKIKVVEKDISTLQKLIVAVEQL